jgi:hypothetical protein
MSNSLLSFAFSSMLALLGSIPSTAALVATDDVFCQSTSSAVATNPPSQSFHSIGGAPISCSTQAVFNGTMATAQASSAPGSLRGFALAAGEAPCDNCGAGPINFADAQSAFVDTITVHPPPGAGLATAGVIFFLHGTQEGTSSEPVNNPFADSSIQGGLITGLVGVFQNCSIDQSTSGTVAKSCLATAPIDLAHSPILQIQEALFLEVTVTNPQHDALADFTNTAGIREIDFFDSNGNPIPGITLTSASGATYEVGPGVPEPSTVVMICGAMVALIARTVADKLISGTNVRG